MYKLYIYGKGGLSMYSYLSPIFGDIFLYFFQSYLLFAYQKKNNKIMLGPKEVPKDIPMKYNTFLTNPGAPSYASLYYYIGLMWISIGGKCLKLPSKLLTIDNKRNSGTIIDSGNSFNIVSHAIYKHIVDEFCLSCFI